MLLLPGVLLTLWAFWGSKWPESRDCCHLEPCGGCGYLRLPRVHILSLDHLPWFPASFGEFWIFRFSDPLLASLGLFQAQNGPFWGQSGPYLGTAATWRPGTCAAVWAFLRCTFCDLNASRNSCTVLGQFQNFTFLILLGSPPSGLGLGLMGEF